MSAPDDRFTLAYEDGYDLGQYRVDNDHYDPRWDFAAAAKAGTFDAFKRGFEDGFDGKERTP
jgi:hypothetical protein